MKQKDIALILVIAFISAVLAVTVSSLTVGSKQNRQQQVEVVDKISDQFIQPSKQYFNENSVNPTQIIRIGDNNNQQPINE